MAYTYHDFKTKRELKAAVAAGKRLNQHMVISGHGDSGQPEPEEVSDAS